MNDNCKELKLIVHKEFGEIRTIIDADGSAMFCGVDVAKALGYARPRDAIRRHAKGALKQRTLTSGGIQEQFFIYEPDLYRLLIKSKLPKAIEFERWVVEEVLPSIRKYGMYATDELTENRDKLLEMASKLKTEKKAVKLQKEKAKKLQLENRELISKNKMLEVENHLLEEYRKENEIVLEEIAPLIDYAEIILGSNLDMTVTQIAADYGISAIRLNNLLHEAGIQRKVNGQWVLYRKYMNSGYTNSVTGFVEQYDHCYIQTKWTQEGRLLIHEIMKEAGIKPICELGGKDE